MESLHPSGKTVLLSLSGSLLVPSKRNWTQNVISTIANLLVQVTNKPGIYIQLKVVLDPETFYHQGWNPSISQLCFYLCWLHSQAPSDTPHSSWITQTFLLVALSPLQPSFLQSFRKHPRWAWLTTGLIVVMLTPEQNTKTWVTR